ncbi:GGDEF domain-containing protein [Paenibacillus sp. GCM10027626]|uniref:GGDEF domain-containing protein n=1 Tax=Paenibacillus sp. GCM10027626 TaxID=3273411 RepID=UPI00363A847F
MKQLSANDSEWNRKLLHLFWWIIAIYLAGSMISLVVVLITKPHTLTHFLIWIQTVPTVALLSVMGIGYFSLHYFKRGGAYTVITTAMLIIVIFLLFIPELYSKYEVLCFPIIMSAIYYDSRKIAYASSSAFIVMSALYLLDMARDTAPTSFEIITSIVVISAATFISFVIMSRGIYLLQNLKRSMDREKELFAQSVQKDRLSKIDALTALYNHRTFQEHTDYLVSSLSPDVRMELALLDIDDFKNINDTYGHLVGDQVLRTVGERLTAFLDPGDYAFRYGGEEFAILFIEKDHNETMELCYRLLRMFRETEIPEMPGRSLTVSIGVARYKKGTPKDVWFNQADRCLYTAKRNGKDRVVDVSAK